MGEPLDSGVSGTEAVPSIVRARVLVLGLAACLANTLFRTDISSSEGQ